MAVVPAEIVILCPLIIVTSSSLSGTLSLSLPLVTVQLVEVVQLPLATFERMLAAWLVGLLRKKAAVKQLISMSVWNMVVIFFAKGSGDSGLS